MWKKAFAALLSLNLLVVAAITLWVNLLPKATEVKPLPSQVQSEKPTAPVQIAIGQDAINTYLVYALSEQTDVQRVLAYARVFFSEDWDIEVGVKLAGRVVPCDINFAPSIQNGNLVLKVKSATMGGVPVWPRLLVLTFQYLPWPSWIGVDTGSGALDINFTERPQHPYGLRVLSYSPQTRLLTLLVTIMPKTLINR